MAIRANIEQPQTNVNYQNVQSAARQIQLEEPHAERTCAFTMCQTRPLLSIKNRDALGILEGKMSHNTNNTIPYMFLKNGQACTSYMHIHTCHHSLHSLTHSLTHGSRCCTRGRASCRDVFCLFKLRISMRQVF